MASRRILVAGLLAILSLPMLFILPASAEPAFVENQKLQVIQLKITSNHQFVTIYNPNDTMVEFGNYELIYLNADKKPTKTFTFSGQLGPKSYFILNDGQMSACHLMTIESASMAFSTTGGSVQLWQYKDEFNKSLDSNIAWVKTKKTDTPISSLVLPANENEFLHFESSKWLVVKPLVNDACQLENVKPAEETEPKVISYNLLPGTMPPVRYVSASVATNQIGNRNPGKMGPVINELLPNPASPKTDANDEFIELYNPNSTNFDLTEFQLAFGAENPRKYTFPEGTVLKPNEFKAFTSGDTSISLSNSEAQVWLLDPSGKVIGQSDPYENAKDGQAWAFNNGVWQWSSAPSPNESNTLTSISETGENKDAAVVLGITSGGSSNPGATLASATTNPSQLDDAAPLHPLVLAGVGLLAVAYAIYEYRNDIRNGIFKFRRYLRLRRETR